MTIQTSYMRQTASKMGQFRAMLVASQNMPPDIMDLTEGDDEMDVGHLFETQYRKPILDNPQN